jgi:glycosyltransferase involved in cell wall biosynthesis
MPEVPILTGPGGRPLRVGHLTTVDLSLAKLLETELRVDVAAGLETFGLSAPGPYVAGVEALGVRHVPIPSLTRSWQPARDAAAAREIAAALRYLQLDVLHTHNPKTGVLGRLIGRALRVPVVVNTCHGLWAQPTDRLRRRALVLTAEAVAAQASHAELYQNAEDQAALARYVSSARSQLVGNGTDLATFRPDPLRRATVRRDLGLRDDELVVGGVGRRVAEKGIHEFATMARALGGRATFLWVGPDDHDKPDAVRDTVDGVRFVGERDDMPAIYNALDIFVLPSYREGFSRSGMEAAASGLPLVLSDIRGCREIGEHRRQVLLVSPRDADALTAAVAELIDDVELRTRLAAAARERALSQFDQVAVAAASLHTYADVSRRRALGWTVQRRSMEAMARG